MSSSQARSEWRERRTKIIYDYAQQYNLHVVALNDGYQLRIDNIIDIYPTNGRYHVLFTSERGDWHLSTGDLRKIIEKARKDSGVVISDRTDIFVTPDVSNPNFDFGGDDEPVRISPYIQDYPPIPERDTYRLHKIKFPEEYPTEKRKWWQIWKKK